jgi:hypothetical protein
VHACQDCSNLRSAALAFNANDISGFQKFHLSKLRSSPKTVNPSLKNGLSREIFEVPIFIKAPLRLQFGRCFDPNVQSGFVGELDIETGLVVIIQKNY